MPATVQIIFDGKNEVSPAADSVAKDIKNVEQSAESASKGFSGFGTLAKGAMLGVGVAVAGAGVAIGGFLKDSVSAAGSFESGMNDFKVAVGDSLDAAGLKVEDFSDLFIDLGKKLPVSTSEVQQAAVTLAKGGLDPATIAAGGLESSLKFAAAAGMGLSEAAELSIKQLGTFVPLTATAAEQAEFMAHSQDMLVKAAGASTLNVDQLGDAMLAAGGQAKAVGLEYDDFVTTMGLISPSFGSAAEAGTSFKNFLVRLQPSTKGATAAMEALGLYSKETGSAFYDQAGNFIGMQKATELLKSSTEGLTNAERVKAFQTIFGNDAMGAAIALADGGGEAYTAFAAKMDAASGVQATATTKQEGFNIAMDNMQGSIEALQITIGTKLLPILTPLIGSFSEGINQATTLATVLLGDSSAFNDLAPPVQALVPLIQNTIAGFQTFIADGMAVIDFLGSLAGSTGEMSGSWAAAFQSVQDVTKQVMTAVQDIIQTVMGVITDFWNENGDEIMADTKVIWETIGQVITVAVQLIGTIIRDILAFIKTMWAEHGEQIKAYVKATWDLIYGIVKTALDLIRDIIKVIMDVIKGDWSAAWEDLKSLVSNAVTNIAGVISSAADVFQSAIGVVIAAIDSAWGNFIDGAYNMGAKFVDNIKSGFMAKVNEFGDTIRAKIQELRDMLPGSEPKDPTSPLRNLGMAGEAIVGNIQAGMAAPLELPPVSAPAGLSGPTGASAGNLTINVYLDGQSVTGGDVRANVEAAVNAALAKSGQRAYGRRLMQGI